MATAARESYQAIVTYKDHATRNSSIRFNVSSADVTAWRTDTTAGGIHDAFAALAGMTLDDEQLLRAAQYADDTTTTPGAVPASEAAVNSAKLLVLWVDSVTHKKFSMQIPARDPASYTSIRGLVDIGLGTRTTQVSALFTDLAPVLLSEDGNASDIYEIRVIGKGTAA